MVSRSSPSPLSLLPIMFLTALALKYPPWPDTENVLFSSEIDARFDGGLCCSSRVRSSSVLHQCCTVLHQCCTVLHRVAQHCTCVAPSLVLLHRIAACCNCVAPDLHLICTCVAPCCTVFAERQTTSFVELSTEAGISLVERCYSRLVGHLHAGSLAIRLDASCASPR